MIPTREQIAAFFHPYPKAGRWLRAMRDEIDRLQPKVCCGDFAECGNSNCVPKLRHEIDRLTAELKAAHDDESEECDRADRNANTAGTLRTNLDKVNVDLHKAISALAKAGWTRDGAEWKPPIGPNPSPLLEQIDRLRADLDRANTEAALARDAMAKATTDTRAKVQNELRSVERALCSADVLIKYAAWSRGAYECHVKNTIETAIEALRDDSATTPYSPPFEGDPKDCAFKASDPVREEEIKAWRDWALGDIADPDLYDDCFVLSRAEIDAAVALMRRAGDGKALLRELRAWIIDEKWCAPGIVRKIDEMLAQPAPVEQPAPPAAAVPDDIGLGPVTDEMVQSGIAAVKDGRWITLEQLRKELAPVPDDPRWELVAQLAEFVAITLKGEVNRDEVQAIAKQLQGGA